MPASFQRILFVALGGGLGTLFRYAVNVSVAIPGWPIGTLIENLSGALLLGVTTGFLASTKSAPDWLRTGVGVGFCGGYTTMSTFAADSFVVYLHQAPAWAAGYVGVSLVFGLLFAWTGLRVGRRITGPAGGDR